MGTGSFSGGGSGALGRASSGASASSGPPRKPKDKKDKTPSSEFFRNNGSSEAPSVDSAGAVVRDTFAQRGVGDYMTKMVSSPAVRGCFEELFLVSVLLRQEQNWDTIKDQYGVRDAPGCLADLATTIKRKHIDNRSSEAFREIAGAAVADILLAAVGEDDDVYLDGRAKDVFAAVRNMATRSFARWRVTISDPSSIELRCESSLHSTKGRRSLCRRPLNNALISSLRNSGTPS